MPDLLLEILSEEMPARGQARAAADLARLVGAGLDEAGLAPGAIECHVTPRRLALFATGLPAAQADAVEERKGPRVGAPEQAIAGFLRSVGLARDQLETRTGPKGEFYVARIERAGQPTATVLREVLPAALTRLPWPKSMRWGDHDLRWVRPIHSLLCLFDGAVVPFSFGHLTAGDTTRGHRFMAPEALTVTGGQDYRAKLAQANVMLNREARKTAIHEAAVGLAAAAGLSLREDPALLDEVAGLVEWPVVLKGAIDGDFMALPAEVLTTAMRTHQKYFALDRADGTLAASFLVVANLEATDGGAAIRAGNEKVLSARLADARFFWDQDRKRRLEDRIADLDGVVFHARLGSLGDKARRLAALAAEIADRVPGADADPARRAASLAKADLTTEMVAEFPELQGVMGRYYALGDGEPDDVATAIAEHYSPQGPGDACPSAPVSFAVSLADKIDTLVGFFTIDEKPTGSKDPYALRRAALGVIRLIVENGLRLPLHQVFQASQVLYGGQVPADRAVAEDLLAFFADRLKVHLRERGVRHDLVSAVFALGGEDDLVRLLARVEALAQFLAGSDGADILAAYRRAANILRIEEKKDGRAYDAAADPDLFQLEPEGTLQAALRGATERADAALAAEDFAAAMAALAELRGPVDRFFDVVTVNAEDPALRRNRLHLLAGIREAIDRVADFSKIEG